MTPTDPLAPTPTISKTGFCWTRSIDEYNGEVRVYYRNGVQVLFVEINGRTFSVYVVWRLPNNDPRGNIPKHYGPYKTLFQAREFADMAGIGFVAAAGKGHWAIPALVAPEPTAAAPVEAVAE